LRPEEASRFVRNGGDGNLSMEALVELLKAVTEKKRSFRVQAHGSSMFPFIKDSDYITISPLTPCHPRLGDIVAFINPETNKLIVHRVVGRKKDHYLIKGDNNPKPDGLIPKSSILGYVTKVEKEGNQICFGSGFERVFIAFISQKNLLRPIFHLTYRLVGPIIRRIKA
jgi:signal peptidase